MINTIGSVQLFKAFACLALNLIVFPSWAEAPACNVAVGGTRVRTVDYRSMKTWDAWSTRALLLFDQRDWTPLNHSLQSVSTLQLPERLWQKEPSASLQQKQKPWTVTQELISVCNQSSGSLPVARYRGRAACCRCSYERHAPGSVRG